MESLTYRKTDPAVMLQNEIEILLTQIHLMELYIKQAQATAANEAARHRDAQQAELLALRVALEKKENELKQYQSTTPAVDHTLNEKLQALQNRLENAEGLLHDREREVQEKNTEIRSLRARMALVESEMRDRDAAADAAKSLGHRLESELTALRNELEGKNAELLRFQATTKEREGHWRGQVQQLEALLGEKQSWLQEKEGELERAKAEIAALAQRISALELAAGEAHAAAAQELELTRAKFQTELDGLQSQLLRKEETLQARESALAALQDDLQSQGEALRHELHEHKELLEERQRQLQSFQSQTDALHERIAEIEASDQQRLAAAAAELESVRHQASAELAQLRTELAHKEQRLAEQQSAVFALKESNDARFHDLQQQLNEQTSRLEARENELEKSKAEIEALQGRIVEVEASHQEAQALATYELEHTRESLHAELAYLRSQIDEKEHALQDREARHTESERLLQAQTDDLKNLLHGKQREFEASERELQDLHSQLHAQEEINHKLGSDNERSKIALTEAEFVRREIEAELANLRSEIGQKEQSLAERAANFAAAEQSLQSQVHELQCQVREGQASLESTSQELERALSDAAALRAQIAQLEIAVCTAESTGSGVAQQLREQFQLELEELRNALSSLQGLLQERETAFASIESHLNSAIDGLRMELAEKQGLLDCRNTELEQARSEIAALQQQNSELEVLHKQTEKLLSVQGEQIRARVRTEIEALETQLRDGDGRLLAAQHQLNELQGHFDSRVRELQCELADKQLLNDSRATEIEDLKSQIHRLLEQSVQEKQSLQQTDAALNEEIARIRETRDAELAALREQLHRNQLESDERTVSFQTSKDRLHQELSGLRAQLIEKEKCSSDSERDLQATRTELTALYEKQAVVESTHRQEKETLRTEVNRIEAALRAELAARDRGIEERDHVIERLHDEYRGETDGLRHEVAELRRVLAVREAELEEAKAAAGPLRLRIEDLEGAVDAGEQTRHETQAAVAALQTELTLSAQTLRDRESAARQQAQVLQTENAALRTEAKEKHALLESRNEELVRVKADLDRFQNHLAEVEFSAKHDQETAAAKIEAMRTEFQAQIAYLQAELSQKDWALAEKQGARGVESRPEQQRHEAPRRPSRETAAAEKFDEEFILGEPKVAETRDQQLKNLDAPVETVKAEDGQRLAAVRQRRWHAGWRWKRRWKT